MKGADWRLLLVYYKKAILPSILNVERQKYAEHFYETLVQIQWIVYGETWMQNTWN